MENRRATAQFEFFEKCWTFIKKKFNLVLRHSVRRASAAIFGLFDHKFCFQIYWKSNTAQQGGRMKEMNENHTWAAWCSNACSHALFSQDESCGELSVCARFTFAAPYGRPSKGIHIRAVRNSCVSCGGFHVNLFKWAFKAGTCSSREDEWVSFYKKDIGVLFCAVYILFIVAHWAHYVS